MLNLHRGTKIFIRTEPTDMRKGFDGLSAIVEHEWDANPLSGNLFVFSNRRQTLLKLLYWDTPRLRDLVQAARARNLSHPAADGRRTH